MSDFECICTTTAQCAYHADLTKLAADSKTATPDPWVKQSCIPTPEALAEAIVKACMTGTRRHEMDTAMLVLFEVCTDKGIERETEEDVGLAKSILADVIRHAMEQKATGG